MTRLTGFNGIIGEQPKVLILGTMPSVQSLAEQQYYAHPRNAFWPILFSFFNTNIVFDKHTDIDYQQKVQFIESLPLAVWDVVKHCQRQGSLDNDIKHVESNDFNAFFQDIKTIEFVLFNGQKAFMLFKQHQKPLLNKLNYSVLPSTSPANAAITYDNKQAMWHRCFEQVFMHT